MNKKQAGEHTQGIKVGKRMFWRIHRRNLLKEMVENNPRMGIFRQPVNILGEILYELGERCAKINDPILNSIMCRLTIYEIADQEIKPYNSKLVESIINYNKEKAEANAKLIASAPKLKAENEKLKEVNADMLKALEAMWARLGHLGDLDPNDTQCLEWQAAINKAKGNDYSIR